MKLSIITVNLNNVSGLRGTIESVVNQTFNNYEYIIIDGGSSDGSVDMIKEYADKLAYWVSEPDKGIYNAMNKGILKAKGEFLQFLNSGDCLASNHILYEISGKTDNIDILYGNVNLVSDDETSKFHLLPKEDEITLNFFLKSTITHQAILFRKELFLNNLYDETYKIYSDWKFLIQKIILENCSIKYLDLIIVNYHANGFSSDPKFGKLHFEEKNKILAQIIPKRILVDYKYFQSIGESPLLKYIQFLSNTTGFQKLVTCIVGILVSSYKFFKGIKYRW